MRKPLPSTLGTLYIFLGYCSFCVSRLLAEQSQWEGSEAEQQPIGIAELIGGKNSAEYLKDIFRKYGQGDVITLEGFELLLRNVGLGLKDVHRDHGPPSAAPSSGKGRKNTSVGRDNHTENLQERLVVTDITNENGDAARQHSQMTENGSERSDRRKCLSSSEMLALTNQNSLEREISPQRFLDLCPVMIHEIDQHHCDRSSHSWPRDEKMTEIKPRTTEAPSKYVWFYSILAVLVISVSGMLSVAIVPIIRKYFYQKLLQFLVALAIGSLVGDALLHLLPHAMKASGGHHGDADGHEHEHGHDGHSGHDSNREIWLGLTALGGILLFFCAEQLLNFLHVYRGKKEMKKKDRIPKIPLNYMVGEKLSKYSYSSYNCHEEETLQGLSTDPCGEEDHHTCFQKPPSADIAEQDESALATSKCLNSTADVIVTPGIAFGGEKQQNGASKVKTPGACLNKDASESSVILPMVHPGHHHGHSHSHKHTHDLPRTASATAWMVIAGDGLHNFSDGMAIGAAFASSLTGGLSTSIAVFCHELPHELGDFALLLKAGMGTRQALLYNGLSSVLCFMGMLVGLAIGNIHSANSWVFAAAAGMFIYIALVDMMPELNCETGDTPLVKFVIQFLGISIGATIMCLIALYEHDLQKIINAGS